MTPPALSERPFASSAFPLQRRRAWRPTLPDKDCDLHRRSRTERLMKPCRCLKCIVLASQLFQPSYIFVCTGRKRVQTTAIDSARAQSIESPAPNLSSWAKCCRHRCEGARWKHPQVEASEGGLAATQICVWGLGGRALSETTIPVQVSEAAAPSETDVRVQTRNRPVRSSL